MKRILSFILAISMSVTLAACGASGSTSTSNTQNNYASQSEFLTAMAKGIKQRLNNVDNNDASYSGEKLSQYHCKLVGYELAEIEKYENSVFEDSLFDELAHEYISACKAQRTAAENYKKSTLESSLWDGGAATRYAIIIYFYENYNLNITAEQAAEYYNDIYAAQYSVSYDTYADYDDAITSDSIEAITSDGDTVDTTSTLSVIEIGEASPADDFLYAIGTDGVVIRAYKGSSATVVIPDEIEGLSVVEISEQAFSKNKTLKSVAFPCTIKKIGESAFEYCENLTTVIFPKEKMGDLIIEKNAFYYANISNELIINANSIEIGTSAFSLNYAIPEIALLADKVNFGDGPFDYCKSVKSMFFLKNAELTYSKSYINSKVGCVFCEMESLEKIILPANISFTTENTYKGDPLVTVYAEENSITLNDAKAQTIPTNCQDYDSVYEEFLNRYISAGYIVD